MLVLTIMRWMSRTRGPLVVRGPQFEKHWVRASAARGEIKISAFCPYYTYLFLVHFTVTSCYVPVRNLLLGVSN
jgi:hypothetical protein